MCEHLYILTITLQLTIDPKGLKYILKVLDLSVSIPAIANYVDLINTFALISGLLKNDFTVPK